MTHIKYIAAGFALLTLAYCKSTKTAIVTSPDAFVPSDKQVEVAQKRWPNTATDELTQGRNIYVTKCTECHKTFEITKFSEKKWLHEIDDMSPKAKLTPDEKLKLTKHILSYREANAVVKAN
jgi:hypothetical protein